MTITKHTITMQVEGTKDQVARLANVCSMAGHVMVESCETDVSGLTAAETALHLDLAPWTD
jgi:hypothetical protein